MGAVRCASREAGSNLFRPPSPSETFSRYGPLPAGLHQHNSQTPCPVHGHEPGHRHGSPGDHSSRPPTLAFDHLGAPGGSNIPELRALHTHHQRLREDLYNAHRHSIEVRKPGKVSSTFR